MSKSIRNRTDLRSPAQSVNCKILENAELERWHGLERARYWGRLKVHGQAVLARPVSNAKRVAKRVRSWGQPVLLAPGPG